jgi:hypothetical protein
MLRLMVNLVRRQHCCVVRVCLVLMLFPALPAGGGKTALEWLTVLAEQQRALRQREAFTGRDQSNSRRQL